VVKEPGQVASQLPSLSFTEFLNSTSSGVLTNAAGGSASISSSGIEGGLGGNAYNNNMDIGSLPQLPPLTLETITNSVTTQFTQRQNQAEVRQQFTPIPTLNKTLASTGNGNVILIRITDPSAAQLINDPILINTLIYNPNGPFKNLTIKDLRVNRKKSLIAVELTNLSDNEIPAIESITKLGDFRVTSYRPNSEKYVHGLISPVAVASDIEALKSGMIFSSSVRIHKIERMKRRINNQLEDSLSLKITFLDRDLPDNVKIYGCYYKIRPFIPSPIQCYKCQRLNHTTESCKGETRCLLCSENHRKEDCTSNKIKCANCKEEHTANSKQCRYMKAAMEVETIKINEKVPHSEARTRAISRAQNPNSEMAHANHPKALSYSQILQKHKSKPTTNTNSISNNPSQTSNQKQTTTTYKEASTQTEATPGEFYNQKFFTNLRNFILDITNMNLKNENSASKFNLANSAIRNNFGIDLSVNANQAPEPKVAPRNERNPKPHAENKSDHNNIEAQNEKKRKNHDISTSSEVEEVLSNESDPESESSDIWETIEKVKAKRNPKNKAKKQKSSKKTESKLKHKKGKTKTN